MKNQSKIAKIFIISSWILLRLLLLNIIILLVSFVLAFLQNFIEPQDVFTFKLSFPLYITVFFITNFIYTVGNILEIVYLKLWNLEINVRIFEKKFFKAGLLMIGISNITGIIIYFIYYFAK